MLSQATYLCSNRLGTVRLIGKCFFSRFASPLPPTREQFDFKDYIKTTKIPAYSASPDIVLYPDPLLRSVCSPVIEFDDKLEATIEKMYHVLEVMYGAGLAAPQVGSLIRLICISPYIDRSVNMTIINPTIIAKSQEVGLYYDEKCLSFHGKPELENLQIPRHKWIELSYTSWIPTSVRPMLVKKKRFYDMMSCIVQHELDHLDGVLYNDYPKTCKN